MSLLPLGHWWPQTVTFGNLLLVGYWVLGNHLLPHMLWVLHDGNLKQSITHSLVFCSYLWKVIPGPVVFTMKGLSVNQREAFWKKLLSIINTITYNKRHNLTSPHPTKRIHLKLQELQLEGQSSSECVLQAGEYRQGTVLTALSLGTLLCMMEHTSLSASQPLPHPPPKDPTVLLITDRVQNIGLCLPLTLSQILHRQHWKNSSF